MRSESHRKLNLGLLYASGAVAFVGCWISSPRFLVIPLVLALLTLGVRWGFRGHHPRVFALLAITIAANFLPLDVHPRLGVGLPRVLPIVYGLPTPETFQAARRGEVYLGGCVVYDNAPRWVLTW